MQRHVDEGGSLLAHCAQSRPRDRCNRNTTLLTVETPVDDFAKGCSTGCAQSKTCGHVVDFQSRCPTFPSSHIRLIFASANRRPVTILKMYVPMRDAVDGMKPESCVVKGTARIPAPTVVPAAWLKAVMIPHQTP